uniref:Sacsin-like n=1 Tax=Pogona vitticeps TaxID=103695 RepID=A0ABM5EIA6_9SAUR
MSQKQKKRKGFRQRSPPVLEYLQGILRKYPDGGQILKELIQNADDAGAKEVILLYDDRSFGTQTLFSEGLKSAQGPALLAYNNGVFSQADWEGIQSPGISQKKEDPNTVGRFGLGFNSVYHITDFPSILSGECLGVLDPQETALDEGGERWDVDEWEGVSDQFQPFWAALASLGKPCPTAEGHFPGTLFRFPLRQSPSKISENLYSPERVQELLLTFLKDAPMSLLFLRNIQKLMLSLVGSNGTIRELLRAEVTVRPLNGSGSLESVTCTKLNMAGHIKTLTLGGTGMREATACDWLVLSAEAKKESFPELWSLADKVRSRPALSLAYCLQSKCTGRLSCVLPLPATEENTTGLPLHISAPFQLTDDRRHVQWSEEGSQARGADGRWNHLLLEEMLPDAYCQVVSLASDFASEPYGAWPDLDQSQQLRYKPLISHICQRLMDMKLLVRAGDGDPRLLHPREAILLPEKVVEKSVGRVLEKALTLAGASVASVPLHVRRALALGASNGPAVQEATATLVRETLRRATSVWSGLNLLEKRLLLEYVAGDGCYQELKGLPLLPTADGRFTWFGEPGETIFVESQNFPRILLPGLAHRFLPKDLKPELLEHLQAIAKKRLFRNLLFLDQKNIQQNFRDSLPKDWVSSVSAPVVWYPAKNLQHPPLEWLTAFWSFLNHHASSLAPFEGCPMIPLTPLSNSFDGIQLARLLPQPVLLFWRHNGHCLPDEVASLLETLGCTVIRSWEPDWSHHQLREYILEPTPCSVLQAFVHLGVASVARCLTSLSTQRIDSLVTFLSKAASFSQREIEVLKELPLFFKMPSLLPPSLPGLVAAQSYLTLEKNLVPPVPNNLLTPEPILLCRNEAERRLLVQIRGHLVGTPDLCLLCVKAMKKGQYASRAEDAKRLMLWILYNGDSLFSQSRELQSLCCDLPFVECGAGGLRRSIDLYDPENHTLQALLRPCHFPTGSFRETAALRTLRTLGLKPDLNSIDPADVLTAAKEVSQAQGAAVATAKSQALVRICNETSLLSRCSSQEMKQLRSLPWVPATNASSLRSAERFSAPESLRSEKYSALVGLVMGLTNAFCPQAAEKLGLEHLPPPEKVMENLAGLVQAFDRKVTPELTAMLHSIYRHMQQQARDFQKPPAGPAIWNGSGFSMPADIVLAYPEGLDLEALMPCVPPDFQQYKKLFAAWGVRRLPKQEDICQAVHVLADKINLRPQGGTRAELLLMIAVLDWLCACGHQGEREMPVPVRIPGSAGFVLRPAGSVLYCDMDRAKLTELDGAPPTLVHESVSIATAAFLGIEMLSTKLSGLELFEVWGPSEPITLRIRNILREYSQDADIFQELLQNAEDAGAQTCRFLVDLRQHNGTTEGLLDPGMAACHGPALWAQNDALFTESDFTNIVRLGAATKERQNNKIGRFGLGFCTVYHVTDIPSLVSGGTMLIFDPNVTHLQKHIRSSAQPGIRLNVTGPVVTVFPEQFRPFRGVFGCQAGEAYQGTLIRLPFRMEQEAKDSRICPEPFGPGQIKALQASFQEVYQYLLIFLCKVREVSLSELPVGSTFPETAESLARVIKEALNEMGGPNIVQLTAMWGSDVATNYYLLHSCSAKGEAQEMFEQGGEEGVHFSPPVADVALPLCPASTAGQWAPDVDGFQGRVFCFLPLPIESGLPLHLTAPFAVLSNRKGLWDATEKGKWNRALLRDSVLGAWLGALSQLRDMCKEGQLEDYKYYTFWPHVLRAKHPFSETAKAFYQVLVDGVDEKQPVLFSDGQRWCSAKHACFLDADVIHEKPLSSIAARIFSSLLREPQIAVSLPSWVKMGFETCIGTDVLLPNTYNWPRFLRDLVLPNLAQLPVPDRDTLILHALDMNHTSVDQILIALPCIPTTPNGHLKNIKGLVHPRGCVAPLYTPEDGCFPMGEKFLEPKRLLRLEHLGMIKDGITIEELISRARTVEALWHQDQRKACQRAHCILGLLNDHIQESCSNTTQARFRDICFLPALLPGNCHKLCRPSEIYDYKMHPLVGLTEPVLDKEVLSKSLKLSSELKEFLGLSRQPPVATVLRQLEAASCNSNALSRTELVKIAKRCYAFLNKEVQKNPPCKVEISQRVQTFPFVLVGTDFVPVHRMAYNLAFDGAPYLFHLPEEYQEQKELWKCVDLPDTFKVEDYVTVLQTLAKNAAGESLPKEQMDLVVRLITVGIAEALPEGKQLNSYETQSIFFPDQDKVLHPVHKMHFDDTPWLPRENGTLLCHTSIPREIAIRCGIPTTKHRVLSRRRIHGLSAWATDFGAKEDLCTRIANILRENSSSRDVLKEMLQNADDAGASIVHFLWDQHQHPTDRIFSDEWKALQGPALCIYNDQTFQMSDIEGIQRLGCGSKGGRLDATGKYGLGFNTVFYLTDCPAFVTGNSALCVFDPTLHYLPISDEFSPGGMFSLTKDFKETFRDVYDAFVPGVFDLERGTLFRLPLRTPDGAASSRICQSFVSEADMEKMVSALREEADCLLMFLNHVHSIVFSVISKEGGAPKKVLQVEMKGGETKRLEYQKHLQQMAATDGMDGSKPTRVFYKMQVINSISGAFSSWLVGRQIGMKSTDTTEGLLLPHGSVAACLDGQPPGRAFCTLPLPVSTGLPVHINGNFAVDSARQDLRKDDHTNVTWNRSLLRCLVAPLYCHLLEKLRCALGDVPLQFDSLRRCQQSLNSKYLQYFPLVTKDVPPLWQELVTHVYELAYERQLPLVPVYQKQITFIGGHMIESVSVDWSAPKIGCPVRDPYFLQSEIEDELFEVTLQNLGMRLVPAFQHLKEIRNQFVNAGISVLTLDSSSLCCFMKNLPTFCLPCPINQTLVKDTCRCFALLDFCLSKLPSERTDCVEGLPLLVTKDNMLRCFSQQAPVYCSSASQLFPHHQDRFFDCFTHSLVTSQLVRMGFLKDFALSDSVLYIREMLARDSWVDDSKRQIWLREVWVFLEAQICNLKDQDTMKQKFEELISFFKDCAVLPVCGKSKFLVPLASLSKIVPYSSSEVPKILQKLGFSMLDISLLPPNLTVYCINPHLLQTENPASVLEQLAAHSNPCWKLLYKWELNALLRFLTGDLQALVKDRESLAKLKALPLFETHQGKHVPLTSYKHIYCLQSKILEESKALKKLYEVDEKTVFLSDSQLNKRLSKHLGIDVLNDFQQFVQQLLPRLSSLPEARVLEAVKLLLILKKHYYQDYEAEKKIVLSTFRSLAFIRDKQDVPRQVSYFYDEDEMLSLLGLSFRFVPNEFYESVRTMSDGPKEKVLFSRWEVKEFLINLGLQKDISEEDFLKCATQVEREALRDGATSNDLPKRREELWKHLLSRSNETLSDAFLEKVAKVRFLVSQSIADDLCCLHPPCVPHDTPVAPQGSLYTPHCVELSWTSAVTLPSVLSWTSAVTLPSVLHAREDILKRLGVLCTLPAHLVLKNLSNVCQVSCNTLKTKETRTKVLISIYTFLSGQSKLETACLEGLPVVLVGNDEIAEAKNVVVSLKFADDFRPYLYKLPAKMIAYLDLLEKIGVQAEPSIYHYASILARIHDETAERNTLHANLTKAVLRATQFLFQLLDESEEPADLSKLKELYLPCTDGKLYPSNTLVFSLYSSHRKGDLQSTFHFLVDLSVCHLPCDPYQQLALLHLLPEALRPKNLSDITREELEMPSLKLCHYGEHCEFQNYLKELLHSPEFQWALTALLKWQARTKPGEVEKVECVCDDLLSPEQLDVVCCEQICTIMVYNSKVLEGTKCVRSVHVETLPDGKQRIYLAHQESMDSVVIVEVSDILAIEVNKLLGKRLHGDAMTVLRQILACQNPCRIAKVLEKNRVPLHEPTKENAYDLPPPGEDIPEEWYDSLDMSILHTFKPGDYVAYLVSSEPREHYCYAVVLEALGPQQSGSGQIDTYRVDLGRQQADLSAHDLYHFRKNNPVPDRKKSVVPVGNSPGHSSPATPGVSGEWYQRPLNEVKKEVDACLAEIWNLSEEEGRKAIRRLYLCYHPDKNIGQEASANELFKYLQEKIKEREKRERPEGSPQRSGSCNRSYWNFSECWDEWDQQAQWHRRRRQEFTRQRGGGGGGGGGGGRHGNYNFWSFHQRSPGYSRYQSRHLCLKEAKRWLRQAECDLQAAGGDAGNGRTEWLLYKTYQAIEKALTAVEYSKGGRFDKNLSLEMLAGKVSSYGDELVELPDQIAELRNHGLDNKTTQYPSYHDLPIIPNEAFPACKEQDVLLLAQEILSTVKIWIGL